MITFLYRCFDSADNLLYVGIADNWPLRMTQHGKHSEWLAEVASVRVRRFESRTAALIAERAAVLIENPKYNKNLRTAPAALEMFPEPRRRRVKMVQFNVEVPDDVARQVKMDAIEMGMTLGEYVLQCCQQFLTKPIASRRVYFNGKAKRKILGRKIRV